MGKDQGLRLKFQKISGTIQRNKYISSISNGLALTMPVLLGGAVFSLIDSVNIPAYQSFLRSTGLKTLTGIPALVSTNLISLYAVFAIAYALAKQFNKDGFPAGILSLMSFLIVTPMVTTGEGYATVTNLPLTWLGAPGFFVAMFVAIFISRLYVLILDKNFYIKMPKGVPPTIEKSFAAVVPGIIAIMLMLCVRGIFEATSFGDIHTFVFTLLQVPLTKLGSSWWAFLICILATSMFWFVGVHGSMVVGSVMAPIWTTLGLENLAAFQKGVELPHLIAPGSSLMIYGFLGGSGATIGLSIAMLYAKSKRYKTLGKLAILPGILGINEPLMFGLPVVLNTKLLFPLVVAPLVNSALSIIATAVGILPRLRSIGVPMGTPIGISGFIEGGWRVAVFQLVLVVISFLIYYPFFKIIDKEAYNQELASEDKTTTEQ